MNNFISQELGTLCFVLWGLVGICLIWYIHKIRQFKMTPDSQEIIEEEGNEAASYLADHTLQDEAHESLKEPHPRVLEQVIR